MTEARTPVVSVGDLVNVYGLRLPKPCAICGVEIRQEEFKADAGPIALIGKQSTVAHLGHFFSVDGSPGPNYEENLTRLALAHGKSEGWLAPGFSPGRGDNS
jgi:hypothetical protein